ncbi:hypothetical protein ANO11243_093510 [Dothideomycetidae sp. 11243]|nr:hypothetical protein ANO11243_093510 [fungal sp. No.11243]
MSPIRALTMLLLPFALVGSQSPHHWPPTSPKPSSAPSLCPNDFPTIGSPLTAVHESAHPPTGLALDTNLNYYIAYPRNTGPIAHTLVQATSFTDEVPWPSAEIQCCAAGQDAATCFVNVQNAVLDSRGRMWVVDSGIPAGQERAVPGGAKIMVFDTATRERVRTYTLPEEVLHDGLNVNDVRVNTSLGTAGWAFLTDESVAGSVVAVDLDTGGVLRRLFNTSVVRADEGFVGSYDGRPIYEWDGTRKMYARTGADGIALASGSVYWGVLASRRFYYVPQTVLIDASLSDAEVLDQVVYPGNVGSEQAGFTADDRGRVYVAASEQNAVYYVDTLQSEVTETVNGVPPGGSGLVGKDEYVVKTLVRNALIQHADSMAIMCGWLYFCTNQLELSPVFQYNNTDNRKGPFRTYRYWIGRGPAV